MSNKTISDKTVVIFNSPANSGKDIAAQYLKDYFNGDLPSYLSSEQSYEIEHIDHEGRHFICTEQVEYVCVTLDNCKHLNGGSWEVVDE